MVLKITMFSDIICPFCYIGFQTMQRLKPEFDIEIDWRGFEIHPDWPATGMPAESFHSEMSPQQRKAVWDRISAMANAVGLEMNPPRTLYNSHAALAVCEYAREAGRSDQFEERIYRAYFTEDANIADVEVLKKLAADAGLDPAAAEAAIGSPAYELKLNNNTLIAHRRGVNGVPTFYIGQYPLVGAQSEDTVRQILTRVIERGIAQQ